MCFLTIIYTIIYYSILHCYAVKLQTLFSQNNYITLGMCIQTYRTYFFLLYIEFNYVNSKIER